jgi:hypothetical protein
MRLLHFNCAAAEHGTIEAIAVSTAKFCGRAAARASAAVISLARNRSVANSDVPEEEFDDFIIDDDTMPRKVFSLLKLFLSAYIHEKYNISNLKSQLDL